MLKQLKVSRRFALRGALSGIGVAMWLPVLEAMLNNNGTAFAQGTPLPTSFGIFYWGNGVHPQYWTPTTTGDGDAWQLSQNLQDFADLKDAMTLVTGLDMLDAMFKGHGWGVVYVLAGGDGNPCVVTSDIDKYPDHHYETADATQYEPTIDQVIADAIHTNEPYKSLETGVLPYTGQNMGTVSENLAHRGPYNFLPPERDPTALFNRLFGTSMPSMAVPTDIANKLRGSVLDAVLADANRLKMSLGAADSKRIDSHMDGIRSLEQRIAGMGSGTSTASACTNPAAPPMTLADMTAKSHALNQLIAAALSCNLTRVYSHLWTGARDDNTYPTIPINSDHHSLTHGDDAQNLQATQIEKYIMSQYADLARILKATPMGAGTVLDNTIIYGISELAMPSTHIMTNYHIVLMGHGGGKIPGNRHYRAPGRKVTELVLTLMQVMGLQVDTWGSWDKTSTTMPEILG
ncbi:MAG TPA: DUF1552 domain-containing protein [Polyangiaceae bacterium]|jgi:hypothetical protein|nr:DUF1552 domain-containing protein [Polyangiaceae bacterium]